jgi:hypothetical protein
MPNASLQFFTAVGFPRAIAFDDDEGCHILPLERGKAMLALGAVAASADGFSVITHAGIHDSGILVFAAGAVHFGLTIAQKQYQTYPYISDISSAVKPKKC